MKSRSHRPSTNDDWVEEESWTVDCICGVNFDDGEEMVNCDECGVWVHTRCSRYVKSEKLFACDKCKSKNNRNDSEETEVAQLLVELPTKTLRMDNPSSYNPSSLPPPRRPFRLWTDIPIEERVHVQGVPGGDPTLFSGLSSVFGPQLWESTGYVPKKFNFRYREFPSWDEEGELPKEEPETKNSAETHNTDDNGAGVLVSMLKENLLSVPALDTHGLKSEAEDAKVDRLKSLELKNNLDTENLEVSGLHDGLKDQGLLEPLVTQSGKRKKEDLGVLKDKSGKKKTRMAEKVIDFKKKSFHTPRTGLQFCEDRGPKAVKADPQSSKNANLSNILPAGPLSQGPSGLEDHVIDDHKYDLEVPVKLDGSPKTINGMASPLDHNDSGGLPAKGEVVCDADDSSNGLGDGLSTTIRANFSEALAEDVAGAPDNCNASDSTINMVANHLELNAKAKAELGDNHAVLGVQPLLQYDSKLDTAGMSVQCHENPADCSSEIDKANGAAMTTSEAGNKAEDVVRSFEHISVGEDRANDESAADHHESMRDSGGSEDSLGTKKGLTGLGSKSVDEHSKCTGTIPSQTVAMGECKVVASGGGNSSLASSVDVLVIKSPPASMNVTVRSQDMDGKQKETSESSLTSNKDNSDSFAEVITEEETLERPKKLVKDFAKSSLNSVSKSLQSKKVLNASVSKRAVSDSKETILHSTPKSPSLPNVSASSRPEPANMLHTEGASNIQKKASTSQSESASNVQKKIAVLPQKSEKINQSVSQSSSKVSASLTHAGVSSSSHATLSDEELALLLHQELNSSPRVPRVPRMRHAGSLPQLTSPTATSMLMKRTSSTGGKEHILTFRRKAKDLAKDGSHGARDVDEETKKMERILPSADHGRQDSASTSDLVSKREADCAPMKVVQSIKKGNASISGATATSGLSSPTEANEHNLSSTHQSPRNPPEDGKGVVGRPSHRTLPGLIAEIMSKGERMTYEELCNAVLPHWPNLRKHNGERYAYSSHSQAVLDCLRNRNEWARLVDRGPKTSGGRKRRKLDVDPAGIDSEDNDDNRERIAKDVRSKSIESHREEFPKGKRKARKRRRLALQGRGIKDVRRRRRIEEFSDDEIASFSNSSEETILSEDETQGTGNEVATASDDVGKL